MMALAVVVAALVAASGVRGEQVLLLDTTTEATLGWTNSSFGAQVRAPGWLEQSYGNIEKQIFNWPWHVVCVFVPHNVSNWLWTPFIERRNANRIFVEIKFTVRDCSLFPGNGLSCKDSFSLLYYESDVATDEQPPGEPESYKLAGHIATGDNNFALSSELDINTEVRSIAVSKGGVYLAFSDQGTCITILAVKVFYLACPAVTTNFATFPETPTGRDMTATEQVRGTCIEDAETGPGEAPPVYSCKSDGNWTLAKGSCKCRGGYEPDHHNQICNECPPGMFKPDIGNVPCGPCPDYSISTEYAATECDCYRGFYRARRDARDGPCTLPPSAPDNLTVTFTEYNSISLAWDPPLVSGGRNDVTYRVHCLNCGLKADYRPSAYGLNFTQVTVMGLAPMTEYIFQVFSENGVTEKTKQKPQKLQLTAMTDGPILSVVLKWTLHFCLICLKAKAMLDKHLKGNQYQHLYN